MGIKMFNKFLEAIAEYERLQKVLVELNKQQDIEKHAKSVLVLNRIVKKYTGDRYNNKELAKMFNKYIKMMRSVKGAVEEGMMSKVGQSFKLGSKFDTTILFRELSAFSQTHEFTEADKTTLSRLKSNIGILKRITVQSCDVDVNANTLSQNSEVPVIAVDADLIVEQRWSRAKTAIAKRTTFLRNPDIEDALRILQKEIYYTAKMFISSGIYPVFVFDGKAPPEKGAKYERYKKINARAKERIEKCETQIQKCDELGLPISDFIMEEKRKLFMQTTRIPSGGKEKVKMMLSSMGLPVIQADVEADPYCVFLERIGVADGVYTTDSDVLVHGAKHRFKHVDSKALESNEIESSERITLLSGTSYDRIIEASGCTHEQFRDICILAECDYNNNIPNYGIMKAYKDMMIHGSLNKVLEAVHNDKDVSKLNIEACHRLFSPRDFYINPLDVLVNPQAIENGGIEYLNEIQVGENVGWLSLKISTLVERGNQIVIPERFI